MCLEISRRNQYDWEKFEREYRENNETFERKKKDDMLTLGDFDIFFKVLGNDISNESIDRAQKIMMETRIKRRAKKAEEKRILELRADIKRKIMFDYTIHGSPVPAKKIMKELVDREFEILESKDL